MEYYAAHGTIGEIVNTIMEKNATLILAAETIKDVWEIADTPKPYFTGAEWIVLPNSVSEEEMVLWSGASLRGDGPLKSEAVERYMKLFRDFYGERADELLGE